LVTLIQGSPIHEIFAYPDHLKFHSSVTLFAHATRNNEPFKAALDKYFNGKRDSKTVKRL
jgi:uncharacterized protein (DUF1810 family)